MKTEINFEYREISQQELIELNGGIYFPTGRFTNLIITILSFLVPDEII